MTEIRSGAWQTMTLQDSEILNRIRRRVRENPDRYRELLGPHDPTLKDRDANLYFGSHQHLLRVAIRLLARAVGIEPIS